MTDVLTQLGVLAPPPARPVENGTDDKFRIVEEHLGLQFPSDYKRLIRTYGHGIWRGSLVLFNPFTSDVRYNFLAAATGQLEDAEHHLLFPENAPFPLYPEPGGLLPWAMTDESHILYWLTEGEPDGWATVLSTEEQSKYERHDLGCCAFLCEWLQRPSDTLPDVPFCPAD